MVCVIDGVTEGVCVRLAVCVGVTEGVWLTDGVADAVDD